MTKSIKIDTTKRGIAATWETGGGLTSGGSATIVAKTDGSKPRAVFVKRGGHLAGGQHALIAVHQGYFLVHASVRRGARSSARIERIVSTSVKDIDGARFEATAEVEVVNTFTRGEWDRPLDTKLEAAVEAAFGKASTYHCRYAVYVDESERTPETPEQRKRRESEMARQDAERAQLRAAKAAAEAQAKTAAEAASREAKAAGLSARLEVIQARLDALRASNPSASYTKLELGDSYFVFGWGQKLYSEANVAEVERSLDRLELEASEKLRKQTARTQFQPQFEAFAPQVEALGLSLSFGEETVNWRGGGYYGSYTYSQEGLDSFLVDLSRKEEEKAKEEREAAAATAKAKAEAEAADLGLPKNVRIWRRMGGVTNRGCGWVIRPDGSRRDCDGVDTSMGRSNTKRYHQSHEGDMIWDQILPGELVLRYSQADRHDIAHCDVVHRPAQITPAQLLAAKQLEEELEAAENAFGLDQRLNQLINSRIEELEVRIGDLPDEYLPEEGWDYDQLTSKNGIELGEPTTALRLRGESSEYCEGRQAWIVYSLTTTDGELIVLAYEKWGRWNINLRWREV